MLYFQQGCHWLCLISAKLPGAMKSFKRTIEIWITQRCYKMQILNSLVSISCSQWFFLSFIHWPPWKDPPSGLPQHFPHLHREVTPLLKCRNKSTIARLRGPSLWSNDISPSSTIIITPISLYLNCQILELGTQHDLCFFIFLPFHHARHCQNYRNFLLSIFPSNVIIIILM